MSITYSAISPNFHFATPTNNVTDGERAAIALKGIEGSRPCALRQNVRITSQSLVLSLPMRLLDQPENPVEQYRRCRSQRFSVFAFSLLFAHSFPVTPKSFPVNFDNEFRLKPRMAAAFAGDAIGIWSPNFGFSLYFSLLSREFCWRLVRTRLHRQPPSGLSSLDT